MKIINVHIKNKELDMEIDFKFNRGFNLITGSNASGKTLLLGTILYAFMGKKAIKINSNLCKVGVVKVKYEYKECEYLLERKYKITSIGIEDEIRLNNKAVSEKMLNEIFFKEEIRIEILNDLIEFNNRSKTDKLDNIRRFFDNTVEFKMEWETIRHEFETRYLNSELYAISGSERKVFDLLYYIAYSSNYNSPIIIDSMIQEFEYSRLNLLLQILLKLSSYSQVIMTTHSESNRENILKKIDTNKVIKCYPSNIKLFPAVRYKEIIDYKNNNKSTKNIKLRNKYSLNSICQKDETKFIEYKEVKGKNPVASVISVAEIYTVAFLNVNKNKQCVIKWGITDKDRKVVGIKLEYNDRDKLRRIITEKLCQIKPKIPVSSFEILIKEVVDSSSNIIKDLFVVELIVNPSKSEYLYCTSKDEVYIKTDAGKKKLSSIDIQNEILSRYKSSKNNCV